MLDQPQNMTFYQVLEVDTRASTDDIEAAYARLLEVLGPRSLAMYSIPDDSEIARLRDLVQEAYRTLKDPTQRASYDRQLSHSEEAKSVPKVLLHMPQKRRKIQSDGSVSLTPDTEFSGSVLRAVRESCHVSLDELSEITKIGRRYLVSIEQNDYDDLPAPVYIRGFVSEYARVLGLNPQQVCKSYMHLYQKAKSGTA
jgi:flagellar biosynthesis protein FlhG